MYIKSSKINQRTIIKYCFWQRPGLIDPRDRNLSTWAWLSATPRWVRLVRVSRRRVWDLLRAEERSSCRRTSSAIRSETDNRELWIIEYIWVLLNSHLAIPRCVEYEAHWVRNALIVMDHFIRIDDISGLVSWQCILQLVHRNIVDELVQHHRLLLPVDFHCKGQWSGHKNYTHLLPWQSRLTYQSRIIFALAESKLLQFLQNFVAYVAYLVITLYEIDIID